MRIHRDSGLAPTAGGARFEPSIGRLCRAQLAYHGRVIHCRACTPMPSADPLPLPPEVEDEESRFQARTLTAMAVLLIASLLAVVGLDLWRGDTSAIAPWPLAITGLLAALVLVRQRRIRFAWFVFILPMVAFLMWGVLVSGGIQARQITGLMVAVLLAGRMLGARWALILAVVAALFLLLVAKLQAQDLLPNLGVTEPTGRRVASLVLQFGVLGALCWYIFEHHHEQLERIRSARSEALSHAEQARAARRQFETVFRSNPAAMALVRVDDHHITDCNEALLQLLGRPRAAIVGQACAALGLPDGCVPAASPEADTAGKTAQPTFELRRADATLRACTAHWSEEWTDPQGTVHMVLHLIDLTSHRQIETALERSEQRFQDFARASGDWFWETDASGKFTWVSDAIEQHTGLKPADLYGKTRAPMTVRTSDTHKTQWASHMRTLAAQAPFRDFTYQRVGPNGVQWLNASGVPIFDADGGFLGYRGTGQDVTARICAEEKAELASTRLQQAVEELNETFVLCDPDDRIVIANRRFRTLNPEVVPLMRAGGTYAEFLRMACAKGRYPEAIGREDAFIAEQLALRRKPIAEFDRVRHDGKHMLVTYARLPDGATVTRALDITERLSDERKLAASEARLQATLDNAPGVAVQQLDWDGRVLYWNQSSEHLYGYGSQQALGQRLDALCWSAPSSQGGWLESLRQSARDGRPVGPVEVPAQHKNGSRRFVLYSAFAIPETDGSHRFVCMHVDISERRRVEEELQRSQTLLEQVINALPMGIFAKDTDSSYIMANKYFQELMQMPLETLLGTHTLAVTMPEATRRKSLQDDQWVLAHRRTLDQPETLLQGPDGRWIPFHSIKMPLLDADGGLIGLLGINRDISAEKQAKEALQASEARFSALFHHSIVPQVVSYADRIEAEDVNQAFVELTGYPRELLLRGFHPQAPLRLFDSNTDRERILAVLAQGRSQEPIDIHIWRADGVKRTLMASAITIHTASGPRTAWAFNDVTDQRAAQQQMRELNQILEQAILERTEELTRTNADLQAALRNLQASQDALMRAEKLAALGRIVAGVAHELNTPIGNSLLSATTLVHATETFVGEVRRGLRRSRLDSYVATAQEATAILLRNLERAGELVRGFKQVAADQTSSQRRRFELDTVVRAIVLALRPALLSGNVQIAFDIAPAIQLESYPGPLEQVITNLIDNAIVHGYGGSAAGVVTIKALRVRTEPADMIELAVSDRGKGIPPDSLERVFEPFYTTRLGKGGSGLGLHIVYNIVTKLLGGTIAVTSSASQGTRFLLRIPAVAPVLQPESESPPMV